MKKYKVCKQVGADIWGTDRHFTAKPTSDYGLLLREKQKLKKFYGKLTEKQFRRTYQEALLYQGHPANTFISLLERRLDVVLYRANFVSTIFEARQKVSHGHVYVNGTKVTVASYRLSVGDLVELQCQLHPTLRVKANCPDYLEVSFSTSSLVLVTHPNPKQVPYFVDLDPNLIMQYYSK